MQDQRTRSYLMLIGSMLIFGTIGIFRRFIPLSSALLAFTRGILGSAALLLFTALRGGCGLKSLRGRTLALLFLTGGLIGLNWILLFEAYNATTVATATLCYYMEPTFVILLSPIFFREKLGAKKLFCAALSLIGMAFVSGIVEGGIPPISELRGVLLALGASVLYASVVILNKKLDMENAYAQTIVQLFAAAVVIAPYLAVTEELSAYRLDALSIVMIVIVGLLHTGVAYALYFASMNRLSAQSVSVLGYIDPVSALLLSALILRERMTIFGAVGAVLIIGSALLSELSPRKRVRR